MNGRCTVIISSLFFISCTTPIQLDPTAYNIDLGPMETIPDSCRSAYQTTDTSVAVVNFTNNTTFDFTKVVQSNVQGASTRTAVGAAAVGGTPGAAGIVWGEKDRTNFQSNAQNTERQVNAKLSESIEDGVTDEIVNLGCTKIYTRKDLEKIMAEQKFQQSGLINDRALTTLGKLVGVKYIITGSVNNVDLSYKFPASARGQDKGSSGSALADALESIMSAFAESQEGWNVSTDVALRVLDVETGAILFAKVVTGKHIIGKLPYPNYDALIGGIKKAAAKGIVDIRPQLSKWFAVKGYIVQTRTSPDGRQRSALINLGEKQGLKAGSELFVYTFQEITDPFDVKKVSCDIVKLPVDLKVTEQLQTDKAWVIIVGKPEQITRIKPGQLIEPKPMQGQGILMKMGY